MSQPEVQHKTLNAVRSPLVFNALISLLLAGVVSSVIFANVPLSMKAGTILLFFAWCIGISIYLTRWAKADPRSLAYGPNEYLKESQMKYAHALALAKLSSTKDKP